MRSGPVLIAVAFYIYLRITYPTSRGRISLEIGDDLLQYRHYNTSPFNQDEVLPAFVNYHDTFRVAPKYGLSSCQTYKTMSVVRRTILCLLYDSEAFFAYNRSHPRQIAMDQSSCGDLNAVWSMSDVERVLKNNSTNILVTREPIERFLSGFVHLCVRNHLCYGCGEDMRCFLEKMYSRYRLDVQFLPKRKKQQVPDSHFAPQTWFCSLSTRFSNFEIIKYGNGKENQRMTDQFLKVFERSKVEPYLLEIIRNQLQKGKSSHSTVGSSDRTKYETALMQDSYALSLLTKIYFFDFIVFGYKLPQI